MSFVIKNQTAGVVNNIDGDMHVTGGMHGVVATADTARRMLDDLRDAVVAASLDPRSAGLASNEIAEMDTALKSEQPDRSRVAAALNRLTKLLSATGALVHAGAALVAPLRELAGWLGALGAPVLSMLALG
jgi:hypothetical protein